MKKFLFTFALLLSAYFGYSQKGISYQAVILDPQIISIPGQEITGQPLVNGDVWVKFGIYTGPSLQFEEVQKTKTDNYGLVNLLIGSVSSASFNSLVWDNTQKSLQVFVSFNQGASYTKVSDQKLTYNPYALYAETAGKLGGTLVIAAGGTGATTIADAKKNLELDQVNNTSDALKPISAATQAALNLKVNSADITSGLGAKVDKVAGKELSTNDYTTAEKTKLAAITGTNTGDQDLSSFATTADVTNGLALKADSKDVNSALGLKANRTDVTSGLGTKVDKVVGKDLSTNDYTTAEKTKLAAIAGTNTGDQDLSSFATTADVTNGLALKADLASPTFTGTVSGIDKTMVGLSNADNTSDANKPVSTATQTALDLKLNRTANAATATKLATSRNINGVAFDGSSDITVTADAGTLTGTTLSSNVVNSSLTSVGTLASGSIPYSLLSGTVPTWNQNTTGNAATATNLATARNINGVSFDGSADITVSADAGTLSGTVSVVNGGTGQTTIAGIQSALGLASNSVAIGNTAGQTNQGSSSIAIGAGAGEQSQGYQSIAIGYVAGSSNQGDNSVAIGPNAAQGGQGANSVALGYAANSGGSYSTALGGFSTAPYNNSTAIGYQASATADNTIQLGADGVTVSGSTAITNVRTSGTITAGAITYPNKDGSSGQILTTDGSGNISFSSIPTLNQNTTGNAATVTTNANLTGVVTSVGNATSIADGAIKNAMLANSAVTNLSGTNTGDNAVNSLYSGLVTNATHTGDVTGSTTLTIADNAVTTSKMIDGAVTDAKIATVSGSKVSGNIAGNAATATQLATSRTINGVAFDGSSDITVTADAGTLTGTTLSSNVVNSSLTRVGTLTNLTVTNDLTSNTLRIGMGAGSVASNTALGGNTLSLNTTGSGNSAVGKNALRSNTTGIDNSALGLLSLNLNQTGSYNTSIGTRSMFNNLYSNNNTSIGWNAATFTGYGASDATSGGNNNTSLGYRALYSNTLGNDNTAVGYNALQTNGTGAQNTTLGSGADVATNSLTNASAIGYGATVSESNSIQLGNKYVTNVKTSGTITAGAVTYPNIDGSVGKVLTANGNGLPTWQTAFSYTLPTSSNATLGAVKVGSGLAIDGSGILSVSTLNQNTTGNAATATIAGNITATSNTTLTSLSNLNTVGTITSGTWSGTTIAVNNGGTGTSNGSITGTGALTFAAGGTNKNVSILPSGTGSVGIGTNSPQSTAALEVSSTKQGFLPPRMTQEQRDAISSPAQGLMLYCTDCGTNGEPEYYNGIAWVNLVGGAAKTPPPTLGKSYQGGIIFYILKSGDLGYDATTPHGLIAATEDQSKGDVKWDQFVYHEIAGIKDGIGYGSANTTKIINDIGSSTLYAAGLARAYRGGGYSDWYVPSQDELNQLYINRNYFTGTASFGVYQYWSSSQFANWAAFVQDLNVGWTQGRNRGDLAGLRAIRSF